MPPSQQARILDRILGTVRIAKDEVGDTEQAGIRQLHQLGVGVVISVPGSFDQISHRYHRFGVGHIPALIHTRSHLVARAYPEIRK